MMFSDNAPHVRLENVMAGDNVNVICSMTDPAKVIQLMQTANAIRHAGAICNHLFITYLMGARYDRIMVEGDSLDLQVFADIINHCNFNSVEILDAHSDKAWTLIRNSKNFIPNLLEDYDLEKENFVFICPDKGAFFRIPEWVVHADIIYCDKARDVTNGNITLHVLNPELSEGRNCIIVDDICDGGGTFLQIAQRLHNPKKLVLAVTHGIFSKGFRRLNEWFDEIITTNSLPLYHNPLDNQNLDKLKVVNIY